jgi:hypothetical protein
MAKFHGKSEDRRARLAEALRENLRRRKASARPSESGESPPAGTDKNDSDALADTRRNPAVKPF